MTDFTLDHDREARLGFDEAVYAAGKTAAQVAAIVAHVQARQGRLLLTRLDADRHAQLPEEQRALLDYDPLSRTAILGELVEPAGEPSVAIVSAGTSDLAVVREAQRTLAYHGQGARVIIDAGVAGLWRLLRHEAELRCHAVVIVVAGMDAALPSVVGGLVGGVVIAVPTSVGYGVAAEGRAALHAALASCAPGVVVVNVDNGYGAACAALRVVAPRLAERERAR